jgi:uncharacterized protein YjbJ (UPF0337 family)
MANMDETKGKVKEAVGDLTDDDSMKTEGKADQTAGKVKEGVGDAVDKVKNVFHKD